MIDRGRLVLFLQRIVRRHRGAWIPILAAGCLALMVTVVSIVGAATTLNPGLTIERDLGDYDHSITLPPTVAVDEVVAQTERKSSARVGVVSVVDSVTVVAESPRTRIAATEADWSDSNLPTRYEVVAGRFPAAKSEAAVGESLGQAIGQWVTVGTVRMQVTGVVKDRFFSVPAPVLATPGALRGEKITSLYWRGVAPQVIVDTAMASQPPGVTAQDLANGVVSRASIEAAPAANRVLSDPWLVQVPAWGLIALATGLALWSITGWMKKKAAALTSLGVPSAELWWSLMLGGVVWCVATVVAGIGAGLVLGWPARWLISQVHTAPLSPFTWYPGLSLGMLISALSGALTAVVALWLGHQMRGSASVALTIALLAAAAPPAGLMVHLLRLPISTDNINAITGAGIAAMAALGTVALLHAQRGLRWCGIAGRLVARTARAFPGRTVLMGAALILTGAIPVGVATFEAIDQAMVNKSQVPSVPPDVVMLQAAGPRLAAPDPRQFEELTGLKDAARLDTVGGIGHGVAIDLELNDYPDSVDGSRVIMAVDSVAAAERLSQAALSDRQIAMLRSGGILARGLPNPTTLTVLSYPAPDPSAPPSSPPTPKTRTLTAAVSEFTLAEGFQTFSGVVLRSTVKKWGVPLTPGWIYHDLSAEEVDRALQAAPHLGATHGEILGAKPADHIPTPLVYVIGGWLMATIVSAICWLLGRSMAQELGPVLATAWANGVPGRWIDQLVATAVVPTLFISAVFAITAGLFPLWLMTQTAPFPIIFTTSVPILILVAGAYLLGTLGGLISARMALRQEFRR